MARNRFKDAQGRREGGGFVPLPFVVIRSHSFTQLSAHAVKLMNDLLAQYKGDNNGDLCAAWTLMQPRGWKSKDTLGKALKELLAGDWLEVTRQGGRHKATLYALTFYAIDDCKGKLDVKATGSPRGTWKKNEPLPPLPKLKVVPTGRVNNWMIDPPAVPIFSLGSGIDPLRVPIEALFQNRLTRLAYTFLELPIYQLPSLTISSKDREMYGVSPL